VIDIRMDGNTAQVIQSALQTFFYLVIGLAGFWLVGHERKS